MGKSLAYFFSFAQVASRLNDGNRTFDARSLSLLLFMFECICMWVEQLQMCVSVRLTVSNNKWMLCATRSFVSRIFSLSFSLLLSHICILFSCCCYAFLSRRLMVGRIPVDGGTDTMGCRCWQRENRERIEKHKWSDYPIVVVVAIVHADRWWWWCRWLVRCCIVLLIFCYITKAIMEVSKGCPEHISQENYFGFFHSSYSMSSTLSSSSSPAFIGHSHNRTLRTTYAQVYS